MSNPLYKPFANNQQASPMLRQFLQFRKTFNGNPQQIIQNMLNSGKITQDQVNRLAQQANNLYEQFKPFM